jgi:two-component system cell cycle sensor histidine kinase/response regulator CckA
MLVEDERSVLNLVTEMLKRLGHAVVRENTPNEAWRLAREYGVDIGLLVSDVIMPERDGRSLAEKLKSPYSQMECLILSVCRSEKPSHADIGRR